MNDIKPEWFIGKVVERVEMSDNGEHVSFWFKDGSSKLLGVDADCCSHTWIEHLDIPKDVDGATIVSVDEPEMPAHDGHVCHDPVDYHRPCGHDELAVYHTRFRTDRGDIVLEYRNDSNGYYGGNLTDEGSIE